MRETWRRDKHANQNKQSAEVASGRQDLETRTTYIIVAIASVHTSSCVLKAQARIVHALLITVSITEKTGRAVDAAPRENAWEA